jgi:hypothetical protein
MDIEIDSDDLGVEMPEGASLDSVGVAGSAAAVPSGWGCGAVGGGFWGRRGLGIISM